MQKYFQYFVLVCLVAGTLAAQAELRKAQEGGELLRAERVEFKKIIPEVIPERPVIFDDFAPPEDQVVEQSETLNSLINSAASQNERELRDVRLKKLSKLEFIERRVLERSFSNFLANKFENRVTKSKKNSIFKRLAAEIKNLKKKNKTTRLVKGKKKSSISYAYKTFKEKKHTK